VADFLLEIGTEEIPAGMIQSLASELADRVSKALESQGLPCGKRRLVAAPRRIGFFVQGLPERQEDRRETVVGPALSIARGADGIWTKAAEGFAKKQGAALGDLKEVPGPKGPCVGFEREVAGRPTAQILGEVVPAAVDALYLPKAMKWGAGDVLFVRPVRWVVALLGAEVVPLAVKGVASGRVSRGRRVFGSEHVEIARAGDYFGRLEDEYVVADPESRKASIAKQLGDSARSVGGHCPEDAELLETVASLCEGGFVLVGDIPERFLALPTAVMRTCLREHQKFFVVVDAQGAPLPHFLSVVDSPADPKGFIRRGNENVTIARLTDAEFFFEHDKAVAMDRRLEELKGIVCHPKLGTYYDKALRLERHARELAPALGADPEKAARAGRLCKCDLASLLVQEKEFTDLQGIAGGLYAAAQGEAPEVARAIGEHYDPAGSNCPESQAVALADRLDTLVEFFRIGQAPTGSKDPFALRRAASGVVAILCDPERVVGLDLGARLEPWAGDGAEAIVQFIADRARHKWESEGFAYDEINAVLSAGVKDLADTQARLKALHAVRNEAAEDFDHLSVAFKRVRNILKGLPEHALDPAKFLPADQKEGAAERALYGAYQGLAEEAKRRLDGRDYEGALRILATLRPSVDRFFDDVLVMCDPEGKDAAKTALQSNRLALLQRTVGLFQRVADLSEIVPREATA
jgi:glycyl-tRNA synthetase beta chain